MRDVKDVGLVMEGGGMRGVFTSGVLDYFMDQQIEFPYAVGVSAAAGNGLSYISKQRGRAKKTNIDIYRDYDYMGWKFWLKNRNIFDFDFLYHDIPEKILPYDYETYFLKALSLKENARYVSISDSKVYAISFGCLIDNLNAKRISMCIIINHCANIYFLVVW